MIGSLHAFMYVGDKNQASKQCFGGIEKASEPKHFLLVTPVSSQASIKERAFIWLFPSGSLGENKKAGFCFFFSSSS